MAVVVIEDPKDSLEMAPVQDHEPVEAFGAAVRTNRSAIAFAVGARIGVRMISTASLAKTVSKSPCCRGRGSEGAAALIAR
jgi:hypothetical protein